MKRYDHAVPMFLALLLDLLLGDPPNRFHPVAWMGSAISAAQRHAPGDGPRIQLLFGGAVVFGGTALLAAGGRLFSVWLSRGPRARRWLVEAVILKLTIGWRGLSVAAGAVRRALEAGDLLEARRLLNWHLVSRDTANLDVSQVSAATVESMAENGCDGILAPLLYYRLFGVGGALAYRFANTADAMLGYRDPAREWLGKGPARLDDLLNLLPARLTALVLVAAAPTAGQDAGPASRRAGAFAVWRRDARKTASPNAGHPMSAAAGALGVALEKVDHYRLGDSLRPPVPADIAAMERLLRAAVLLAATLLLLIPGRRQPV